MPEELAERQSPRLTAATGSARELGTRAMELVLARVNGRATDQITLLAPVLTFRESCAPPPR
ncbi:hypothetical protein G3I77_27305 [Streptomyces sp. D2-8]|uniref:substrate-binding domain-containing protein n=1 Tax=Streptomyces sp. D2-8 TaxID=2707767 RepID=UPI0020BFD30A|nr:substrate-binding domain-containing protein [Streptomyces sp. D2-8]MCK8436586.1 hypothetical protein [Streptomyces sp. D2-8]